MQKGTIRNDHIPRNKYTLFIVGLPPIVFTSVTGLEEELQTTELPDKTRATGGFTNPVEAVVQHPLHHVVEEAALEGWFQEAQDPVSPLYKKAGAMVYSSGTGQVTRTYTLVGVFPSRRKMPDAEAANEGEMAFSEWTLSIDDVLPPV